MTQNTIAYFRARIDEQHLRRQDEESHRSNLAREQESHRANVAAEQELHRSHVAQESETARSNKAREAETMRHNVAVESIQSEANRISAFNAQTSRLAVEESARHNIALESLSSAQLAETVRANQEREAETHRANVVNEQIAADRSKAALQSAEASLKQARVKEAEYQTRSNSGYYGFESKKLKYEAARSFTDAITRPYTAGVEVLGGLVSAGTNIVGAIAKFAK